MLASLNIIKTLVDLEDVSLDTLVDRLTFCGFEVEDVIKHEKIDNLAIGKVISCIPHPDSDHLHLLKVDIGNEILDIVCGAKNVKEGVKVILALVNCKLPNNITIKESTIRGYKSYGMCCSLNELGLPSDGYSEEIKNGIFICDESTPIGRQDVFKTLGFDDVILDINVLPNRSDCLSYYALCREIASLLNRKVKFSYDEMDVSKLKRSIKCKSETDRCKKLDFIELNIDNNISSPKWLQEFLQKNNINSISALVDIGNYVMKLTGQPIHVYDLDKIGKFKEIVVKDDVETKFIALDNKEYDIQKGDLCVIFDNKVQCLGGIMGGFSCACDSSSKHVLIEAANFFHQNIRITSKRLNLTSESSQYFAKKANPYLTLNALTLFVDTCKLVFDKVNVVSYTTYNTLEKFNNKIKFSIEKLNHRLGSNYTNDEVLRALNSFRIELEKGYCIVPKDRVDLVEQCDLEEEVFRYYSALNINLTLDKMPNTCGSLSLEQLHQRQIHTALTNAGLNQIISFTLISKEENDLVNIFNNFDSYKIANPMTGDHEYVRTDLLPSMISTLNYNINHKNNDLALYEISNVDTKNGVYSLLSVGLANSLRLREKLIARRYDFYDIKGIFEIIMDIYKIDSTRYKLKRSEKEFFHKGISADAYVDNKYIGSFGIVSPAVENVKPYFLMELNLTLLEKVRTKQTRMKEISQYPKVSRDFAFIINKDVSLDDIKEVIRKTCGKYISSIQLFDFHIIPTIGLSVGVNVEFVNYEKTFTDAELKELSNKIIENCTKQLNITLRG